MLRYELVRLDKSLDSKCTWLTFMFFPGRRVTLPLLFFFLTHSELVHFLVKKVSIGGGWDVGGSVVIVVVVIIIVVIVVVVLVAITVDTRYLPMHFLPRRHLLLILFVPYMRSFKRTKRGQDVFDVWVDGVQSVRNHHILFEQSGSGFFVGYRFGAGSQAGG